jgi:prepilin-type N-terminal cleavage/methylation domain-containing protein/prepilin-type processing-associated H-X9-DG protein
MLALVFTVRDNRTEHLVMYRSPSSERGFTMLELLVVIAIITLLLALLLPALSAAKEAARKAACLSNLRQVSIAVHSYAQDYGGQIPYGPKAPPFTSPASFYPSTGAPTSLLSLQTGAPVGLGLLLRHHLADTPQVLFCPGGDQSYDADAELAKVGQNQAQGSYYYRHGGNTLLFDSPANPTRAPNLQLTNLGDNRDGLPITALAMDSQFLSPPDLASFNVRSRTHHELKFVNVLYADGSVAARRNRDGRFTVDLRDYGDVHDAFNRILRVLEAADAAY